MNKDQPTMIQTGISAHTQPQQPAPMEGVSTPPNGGQVTDTGADFSDNPNYKASAQSDQDFIENPKFGAPPSDELQTGSFSADKGVVGNLETAGKMGVAGLEGIGEGVFGTAAGAADLVPGVKGSAVSNELHKLAGDNNTEHGTAQQVGGGLETIGEFLLGDATLKGLSVADKLTHVSKVMKYVEKSPALAQALRLGINVGKAGAELTPEERALLQAHPTLARLAGVGLDALRQGVVQGVQTEVKTGGDTGEALKSGAEMAGGSALLGAPLAALGGIAAKAGEGAKTAEELRTAAQAAPTATEANQALQSKVSGAVQPTIDVAQAAKEGAESKLGSLDQTVQNITNNAPTNDEIVNQARAYAQKGEQGIHDSYTAASNDIRSDPALKGLTIAGKGSAFQDKAANAAFGEQQGDAVQKALGAGVPASPEIMNLVTSLAKPGGLLELGEDGLPKQMDINNLLDYAKNVKEKLRDTGYSTPQDMRDRKALYGLLDGIHQSVEDLVDKAGKPELMDKLMKMNTDYREGLQTFKNPDVKSLLEGKNENAIIKTITGGNSVNDILQMKKAVGPQAFALMSDEAMSRLAQNAVNPQTKQFELSRWIRSMNSIPQAVREEMGSAGAFKTGILNNILEQAQAVNASGVIENSTQSIKDAQKLMTDVMGNSPNLLNTLKNTEQVAALQKVIGPDAMGELGNTILQNQLKEAATTIDKSGNTKIGSVDTGQFIRFAESLKDSPEVVDALFKATPERAAAYAKLLQSVHNVEGVKNMVKIGLVAPALGAAAGGAVGHSVFSALLGSLAAEGAGGYFSKARDFLDTIANHPAMWKTLKAVGSGANSNAAKSTAYLGRVAAGKYAAPKVHDYLKNILGNTQTQLSNQ